MANQFAPFSIVNVPTHDGYVDAATIKDGPTVSRIEVAILNATVAFQFLRDRQWQPEEFKNPWVGTFARDGVNGIRFRSFLAGAPAQVSAILLPDDGADIGSTPTIFVSPSGGWAPPALTLITGIINSDGSVFSGTGFTCVRLSVGKYQITFTPAFSAPPAAVVQLLTSVTPLVAAVQPLAAGQMTVTLQTPAGVVADDPWSFIVTAVV